MKMKSVKVGEEIKSKRLSLKLSQSKLCDGICAQSTLSKIETGKEYPDKYTLAALLHRLGFSGSRYYIPYSEELLEIQKLNEQIVSNILIGENKAAIYLINELKNKSWTNSPLVYQYILHPNFISNSNNEKLDSLFKDEILVTLYEAIRLTIPTFELQLIKNRLLSYEEFILILDIAYVYFLMDKQTESLDIYKQLFQYSQDYYEKIEDFIPAIPMLTYQYSKVLTAIKQYEAAVKIADYGRIYCVKAGRSTFLSDLLALQGICLYKIDFENGKEKIKQAYYLMMALGQTEKIEKLSSYIREYLKIELDELT